MRHFKAIRLAACSLAAAAAVAGIGYYCYAEAESSRLAVQQERQKLDEAGENQKQFRTEMTRIFADLKEKRLTLSEAVDRLEEASRKYNPEFLKQLAANKKVHGQREAIADNIVRHFSVVAKKKSDTQPANEEVLARLKAEQTNLFPGPQTQAVAADH